MINSSHEQFFRAAAWHDGSVRLPGLPLRSDVAYRLSLHGSEHPRGPGGEVAPQVLLQYWRLNAHGSLHFTTRVRRRPRHPDGVTWTRARDRNVYWRAPEQNHGISAFQFGPGSIGQERTPPYGHAYIHSYIATDTNAYLPWNSLGTVHPVPAGRDDFQRSICKARPVANLDGAAP